MRLSLIIATVGLLLLAGCTDEANTVRTLESAGFTDVHTTGYAFWECGKDDTFHTGFTAKNPAGKQVSGTVCCGMWTKGCTIRF